MSDRKRVQEGNIALLEQGSFRGISFPGQEEKLGLSSSTKKEKRPEEADAPYIW